MHRTLALSLFLAPTVPALGVTITPVGPEGRVYHAAKMNERGDILFDLDTVIGLDYQEGDDIPTAELWMADGTVVTILHQGSYGGWTWGFGEDGTTLSQAIYPFGPPDPGFDRRVKPEINASDGSSIVYDGALPYASFNQITADARFIGSGSSIEFLDSFDGPRLPTPIVWSTVTGETQLPLPQNRTSGEAWRANPSGGIVGFAHGGPGDNFGDLVWWGDDAQVQATFALQDLYLASPNNIYTIGGVAPSGDVIAIAGPQMVSISPAGDMTPLGAPEAENVFVFIEDINRHGIMAGSTSGTHFVAAVWTPGGRKIVLQDLMPPDSPWRLTFAHDITDTNAILVEAVHRDFSSRFQSFVITGIPAPGAGGLLGVLFVGCVRRRRN